jgi:hypothetical protein
MSLTFEAKLPTKVPDSAVAYQVLPVKDAAVSLRQRAKAFGLEGAKGDVTTGTDLVSYMEGRHRLDVYRASGAIAFWHRDKFGREPKEEFKLSDKEAGTIARNFLRRSKLMPLPSAQLAKVTHMHSAVANIESKRVRERILDAGVVYRRLIDKLPVEGPGGFAMVTVDPGGDVIALRSVWRSLGRRLGTVKIKSIDEAIGGLERHARKLRGDVTVTKATFGYFELGVFDRQQAIEPAYAFVYVVRAEEVAMKSAFVVHAGDKTFGRLTGKKRFAAGQAQRSD